MKNEPLKIYTLPQCPMCLIVKHFLEARDIAYEELNAQDFVDLLLSKGIRQVPVIQIGDELHPVSSIQELEEILRRYSLG